MNIPSTPLRGGQAVNGKVSWFGGPRDPTDSGHTANGETTKTPGIAVYNHATLGGYWRVTAPNGRTAVIRQTDLGPAPFTGRKIDVTYSALGKFGYNEGNFPTDSEFKAVYLGRNPGSTAAASAPTATARPQLPRTEAVSTPNPRAQGFQMLASLLRSEKGGAENPLITTGALEKAGEPSTSVRQLPGVPVASVASGASSASSLPSGGTPTVRAPKPASPPVKVTLPGYITGKGYSAVEGAKRAEEHLEGHPVSVQQLEGRLAKDPRGLQEDLNRETGHPVIAQHARGNVHQTPGGPVFVPKKPRVPLVQQ